MIKSLFFYVLLICPALLQGQYAATVHYTVKDGLPSSTTYCAVQDSKGFMWVGTDAGLVRFDGSHFKVFTTADGLPDNEVLGLHFDKRTDRMWVITYCKQACYYRKGKFYTSQNDSSLGIIKCEYGEFINGNLQENIGVFLFNGSSVYEYANNKVKEVYIKGIGSPVLQVKKINDSVYHILIDSAFIEWSNGIKKEIYPYHKHSEWCKWLDNLFVRGYFNEIKIGGKTLVEYIQHVDFFAFKKDGSYKLRTSVTLSKGKTCSEIALSGDKYLMSVWREGLYSLDTNFRSPMKKIWSGRINAFFEDKDGNIWITTTDDGLYILKKQNAVNYTSENGLVNDNLTALASDDIGGVYIGNINGEIFKLNQNHLSKINVGYAHASEKVREMTVLKDYLFLVLNSTILGYDINNNRSIYIPEVSGGPKSILKLADSRTILVGLIETMISYDIVTGVYRETQFLKRVVTMAQHPDGRVFCGSLDGLYLYSNNKFTHIDSTEPRLHGRITSLCFSPDSLLWIGTPSSGVMAYDGHRVLAQVSSARYMSYRGAICRRVVAGGHNEIWVATNAGIDRIRYHLNDSLVIDNITPLNTADGLLSDDVNDVLVHDSLIYAATYRGLTILNQNELARPHAAPIYISSFRVNAIDSPLHDYEYQLSYRQNNLQIEYIGVSFYSSGYIRYQYRLLGSSDAWQAIDLTSIDLRSVSPGHYVFEVAVLDKFGNRSPQVARIKFHIERPFYLTLWFWLLVFVIFMIAGLYIIQLIFKRRQALYEKEQSYMTKIVELEQQALKAQMNPHFIFNCLTSIQHFINKEDVYSANMYLSNFAKLIRKTLDLSGEQYITLDKEIAYLENYIQLEKMRFQDKFEYSINIASDVNVFTVLIPPMLLQPIIENAIRHGLRYRDTDDGELDIDFSIEGSDLVCRINDNGIGIKRSMELKGTTPIEYQSKGMKLTQSRIDAINMLSKKSISMEVTNKYNPAGMATGTLVLIRFEQ